MIGRREERQSETIARHEGLYATGASVLGVIVVLTLTFFLGRGG
jgi:hypothetical protein